MEMNRDSYECQCDNYICSIAQLTHQSLTGPLTYTYTINNAQPIITE